MNGLTTTQAISGEIIEPVARCASEDCGYPLTRNADGTDRYGDTEPFQHGCHFGCYVPDIHDPSWAGYIGPDTDPESFFVAAPNVKRVR